MWQKVSLLNIALRTIRRKVVSAREDGLTYFIHKGQKYPFKYEKGVGGGGKRLLIWTGDTTEEQNQKVPTINSNEKTTQPKATNINFNAVSIKQQEKTLIKMKAINEYKEIQQAKKAQRLLDLKIKTAKLENNQEELKQLKKQKIEKINITVEHFCEDFSIRNNITLTKKVLFNWINNYKEGGLDSLLDNRAGDFRTNKFQQYNCEDYLINLIRRSYGNIKASNLNRSLHAYLAEQGYLNYYEYLSENKELISTKTVERFIKKWAKDNPLEWKYITEGEDKVISHMMPAAGNARWNVDGINQIWEIDESPLDAIVKNYKGDQIRPKLFNIIDIYSSRVVMMVADSADSYAVARLIAKAILILGKPVKIKGDNGKNFKSNHVLSLLGGLNIEYEAVAPYSGWKKSFTESIFKRVQHTILESIPGFIGHNLGERQAIEASISKRDRRTKQLTNLTNLISLEAVDELIDNFCRHQLDFEFNQNLQDCPINVWNKSIDAGVELISIDDKVLSASIGKHQVRKVVKKGISYNGSFYFSVEMYNYREVKVIESLENIAQLYLYSNDNKHKFIDIAVSLDVHQVSHDKFQKAQKLFSKKLNKAKSFITKARELGRTQAVDEANRVVELMGEAQREAMAKSIPKQFVTNNDIENAQLRIKAQNTAPSVETVNALKKSHKTKPKAGNDISWKNLIEKEFKEKYEN